MVKVFRALRRVLRHDGTIWLNLGDSYSGGGRGGNNKESMRIDSANASVGTRNFSSLPSGNLMGMPWRVALALQADGWVLRQDIVWLKPSPMPESVTNRCTKSHEYIFLLTKSMDYFYDAEAIREQGQDWSKRGPGVGIANTKDRYGAGNGGNDGLSALAVRYKNGEYPQSRNKRSVWSVDDEQTLLSYVRENNPEILEQFLDDMHNKSGMWRVASQPYPGAHYATFPKRLIEPCILAGTSAHGACVECGAPWERVISKAKGGAIGKSWHPHEADEQRGNFKTVSSDGYKSGQTLGWRPTCHCKCDEVRPCVVLDPFVGSGTTIEVCIENNRWGWGIDLSEVYLKNNAIPRISACINERPALRHLLPQHEVKRVVGGRSSKRTPPPSS
jgi:DNA modification methylase